MNMTIVEPNETVLPSETLEDTMQLSKSVRDSLWAIAISAATLSKAEAMPAVPMTSVEAQTVAVDAQGGKWTPAGVDHGLIPIAQLESNMGKNVDHVKHSKGDWFTAFGALGFKPMTAHDFYTKSPAMQTLYPDLQDPVAFIKLFQLNPQFYNLIANRYFSYLKQSYGNDTSKAVYSWRWGVGACLAATEEQIAADPYVQAYFRLSSAAAAK